MATNLDRLFREKLDQVEMTPSAQSWDLVKGQINQKKPVWVMPLRIAAAITLLVSASIIVVQYSKQESGELVADVNRPIPEATEDIQISSELTAKVNRAEETIEPKVNRVDNVVSSDQNNLEEVPQVGFMSTYSIAKIGSPVLDVQGKFTPPSLIGEEFNAKQPTIKITYIASNNAATAVSTDDKEGPLSKMFSLAKEVSKSELLADIRDAKDNLFSKN